MKKILAWICIMMLAACPLCQAAEIRLVRDTTLEMLEPEYWNADDAVLLNAEEIADVNAANPPIVKYHDANGEECAICLYDLDNTISGETLRNILAEFALPEEDAEQYANGELATRGFWNCLDANRGIDDIPDAVEVRYAVCTERAMSYAFPSEAWVTDTAEDIYYNNMNQAEIMPGDCVAILWESVDEEWYFIDCGFYMGWTRKEYLALCHDRAEWEAYANPEEFLVILENNLLLEYAADGSAVSEMILPMGMKARLAEEVPESVHGRVPVGCYVVELPTRGADGYLEMDYALIPMRKAVSVGYPAFTAQAFLEQIFRFQGQAYGWCGDFNANDCSGIIRQALRCFGIQTPRNSRAIINMSGLAAVDISEYTLEERMEFFETLPIGSLCLFPGHIMVYLGMENDIPYVISSAGSFAEEAGGEVTQFNAVLVNPLTVTRRNGISWLESMTKCLIFSAE